MQHAIASGACKDTETGLHQNWWRDYDPSIGRYLQSDSLGLEADLNTYAYADNNPIGTYDEDGLNAVIRLILKKLIKKGRPPPTTKDRAIHKPEKKTGFWSCKAHRLHLRRRQ